MEIDIKELIQQNRKPIKNFAPPELSRFMSSVRLNANRNSLRERAGLAARYHFAGKWYKFATA